MTDPMTTERLDEIEARANAATQGPWERHPYMGSGATLAKPNHPFHELNILKTTDDWPPVAADAEFIAAARTDVPALLAEVRRLQAAAERVPEPLPVVAHKADGETDIDRFRAMAYRVERGYDVAGQHGRSALARLIRREIARADGATP